MVRRPELARIVADALMHFDGERYRMGDFVIMPTHVHLIVFDAEFDAERLKRTLVDLRKFTGRELADYCADHMPACFAETLKRRAGDDRPLSRCQRSGHAAIR